MKPSAPEDGTATSDERISAIKLLSTIAKANGSILSIQDLVTLTGSNYAERVELEESISTLPNPYKLLDGFVVEQDVRYDVSSLDREREKRVRAYSYAGLAREFASFLKCKESSLVAISGSTSYQTPSEKDDLDFFCVTTRESLWIFLTRALLLSRFFHLFRRNTPRLCFSYVADEDYTEADFAASNDALFARDALTAKVISGGDFYARLLNNSSWIADYFPRLYQLRTRTELENRAPKSQRGEVLSTSRRFLNTLLFHTVGNYIALKSFMLNHRFSKQNKSSSVFKLKIGSDHCIFESVRYNRLRTMYASFNPKSSEKKLIVA